MVGVLELVHQVSHYLHSLPVHHLGIIGYLLLAGLVAVEGPIATLLGAAAAAGGLMEPGLVFLSASIGNLTADLLWYCLGRSGNPEWLATVTRRFKIKRNLMDSLKGMMRQHAAKILFLAKLTAGLMIPSLLAAGLVRAPVRRWFPFLALGEAIWTGSLVMAGYFASQMISQIEKGVQYLILAGTLAMVVIVMIVIRRLVRKSQLYQDTMDLRQ